MHGSLLYWLRAQYRATPPEMAQDASPARVLQAAMRRLARRWQRRFDDAASELAAWFATTATERSDAAMRTILKKAGMTVQFRMTAPVNDVLQATTAENVALIKSIASQHLTQVEGIVMRSVSAGRDLGTMAKDLEQSFGVTKRRAAFISKDQNNKATANITRVRQTELGITEARWVHSAGGVHPRASHMKAGREGLVYEIAKGALIDGEYILPGQLPNCRCVSRSIIKGFS